MASIASILTDLATSLRSRLSKINTALVNKGQTAADTYDDVPAKIEAIETGADVSGVTATASDVKSGKYYVNSNGTLTQGTMGTANVSIYKDDYTDYSLIKAKCTTAGYLSTGDIVGVNPTTLDSNLASRNIKKGETVMGVTGSYDGEIHASYLTDVEIGIIDDISSGFSSVALGAANYGDVLKYVSISKETSASTEELVSLTLDVANQTGIGWCEISSGTYKVSITSSDFSDGYVTAYINVVADSSSFTGYSAKLNLYFTIDVGDITDGDEFNIFAVWGKA